ncbi:hypothetical protein ABPG73_023085 [Tetrahymena malaccensis]
MTYFSFYFLIQFIVFFSLVHPQTTDNSVCSNINSFYSIYQDTCLECSANCKMCSSLDSCQECSNGYFLGKKGQCLSNCGINEIVDYVNKKCLDKLNQLCLIYDQQNQCLKCQDGYTLNKDQICINTLCSQYQATYDQYTNKCSLDSYLLSQSSREQQNDTSQNGFSQQQYVLKYTNFSENLNEIIVDIIITQVFDKTIVIGITVQHIILYDYETMLVIQILKFNSQIISTLVQDKEMKLIALLSDNNNQFYAFSKLIAIDLVCYQITTITEQDQLLNQIFFNNQYLVLNQNGSITVIDFNYQKSYQVFQNLNIQNISLLEKEGIFLAQDAQQNIYLSNNSPFLSFNQVTLSSNQQFLYIQQIYSWSLIPLIEIDQSNNSKELLIFNITQQFDVKNNIFYTIGELQQKIGYNDQQIYLTKQENLILFVSFIDIELWQKGDLIQTIDVQTVYLIQIDDDYIALASSDEIFIYPIQKRQNEQDLQKFDVLFKDQISFIQKYQNFVVVSFQNNIQKLNQSDKSLNKYQAFQSSFNHLRIQKNIISTLVYSSDNYSITHLIIQYDTAYLIISRLYDEQVFFMQDLYTQINQMYIVNNILFIQTNSNQLYQTNIETKNKQVTQFKNIFQIFFQGSSLYILDKIEPDICFLQLYNIGQSQTQTCRFQLNQNNINCQQDQVVIKSNLIVINIPQITFQVQNFDCSIAYETYNNFSSFVIIDSNTILFYDFFYNFYVISINQSNQINILTQYNLGYDYFDNLNILILKPSIPNIAQASLAKIPLQKIYLNKFNNLFKMSLSEYNYTSKISSFIINVDGNKLQYLDMTYPIFSYSTIIFQDQIKNVDEVAISSSLMIISFINGKILDFQIENYLVIDLFNSEYPTNLIIYQFNESDSSFIIFKYRGSYIVNLKLLFNEQYFNNTRSILALTVKDNVIAQFWKMTPITLQNNNPISSQINQLFLPCSNNTRIKLDSQFFYFMCPFVAQIYSQNITFVSNIKYIVGFNQTIQDIKYLNYSIFAHIVQEQQSDQGYKILRYQIFLKSPQQIGNYTKSPIYLQFFDEEDSMLNFGVSLSKQISQSILSEINNYKISLQNYSNISGLIILFGEQLQLDIEKNLFQLNITAGSVGEQTYELILASNFQDQQISIDLSIQFRKCIIGEVRYPKQNYISCDKCQQGTYSLVDPNQNNNLIQCLKCPQDSATNCYSSNIILKDHFWRESNLTDQIYPCQLQGCSETSIQQIDGCLEGYIGPLCSSCDYKSDLWEDSYAIVGKQCVKCSDIRSTYIYFALQLIFYILYILICLQSQVQKSLLVIKLQYLRQLGILQISKTKYMGQDSEIIIKIFLSYLQIFSTCIMSFAEIPTSVSDIFKYGGDPIQMTYKSLDCSNYYMQSDLTYQCWVNNYLPIQLIIVYPLAIPKSALLTTKPSCQIQKCFSQ